MVLCFGFLTKPVLYHTSVLAVAEQVHSYHSPIPLEVWGECVMLSCWLWSTCHTEEKFPADKYYCGISQSRIL